jgi:hypothetical protein
MKARTFLIMTGATLALAAPAAQANLERVLPGKHAVTAHHKIVAKKVVAKKATTPNYTYYPAPTSAPSPADDCIPSGNNCTDQQLCEIWGMNCDLFRASPASTASPAEPAAPVASPASVSSSAALPAVASSTTIADPALCPVGGMWDEENYTCV